MLSIGSLFSGVGGFEGGFEDAGGFRTLWQVEICKDARRVLNHHWPDADLHSDIREVGKHNLALVDVIVGGFPCQDLSVAGKRGGIEVGSRSGLFFEMMRVVDELRPAYLVWENVPGLLSNRGGRDFATVLWELDRIGFAGGWTTLDARFFGLAQRRRRVFGVFTRLDSGARRAAEILSFARRSAGNNQARCEAGSGVANAVTGGTGRVGSRGCDDGANDVGPVYSITPDAFDREGEGSGGTLGERPGLGIIEGQTQAIRAKRPNAVAATLNSGGNNGGFRTEPGEHLIASPITARCVTAGSGRRYDADTDDFVVAGAIQSHSRRHGHAMGTQQAAESGHLTAFAQNQRNEVRDLNDLAGSVASQPGMKQQTFVAEPVAWKESQSGCREGGVNATLDSNKGSRRQEGMVSGMTVRRLTPTECCRLQGFTDDWLNLDPPLSDSAKYRLLGNAVARPVAKWIGQRIKVAMENE